MTFPVGLPKNQLQPGWSLHESTKQELWELEQFYKHYSGGLLLDILNPARQDPIKESLENVARRLGFMRKWNIYSLVKKGCLKAVLIVNQSDVGVNLSELLNGIKAIIIDPECLPWEVFTIAVAHLTDVYHLDNIPLLIYPSIYADITNVPYEKKYQLLIMNGIDHQYEFMDYMQQRFRMKYE